MIVHVPDPVRFERMNTGELRESFLVDGLFLYGQATMKYFDADRAMVGGAVPARKPLALPGAKDLASAFFAERREIGVLNIGEPGQVDVDGQMFPMNFKDVLYIGRGSKNIVFKSSKPNRPACYYWLSFPAHKDYPTKRGDKNTALRVRLGSETAANRRTIYKMVHPEGIRSCQLVMGFTEIERGSVWNTMPPHTHPRRMEVYLYFEMEEKTRVIHLMGPPNETRHLVIADRQAVVSPSWSIHAGVGTGPYTFCWAMGGENQVFDDMDAADTGDLR